MINKDLGMVTAYAYAVSKGYAGTEDEFATLMASYADVGQRAEQAATAAAASATAASGSAASAEDSAITATTKADEAGDSSFNAALNASRAAASATAASGSVTAAAQSATAAAGSATTAGNKATEASQSATSAAGSATTAGASATAAQAAQTAAEAAQTAAETAQGAAEDAAESVSASAAQIAQNTAEISLVKSQINEIVEKVTGYYDVAQIPGVTKLSGISFGTSSSYPGAVIGSSLNSFDSYYFYTDFNTAAYFESASPSAPSYIAITVGYNPSKEWITIGGNPNGMQCDTALRRRKVDTGLPVESDPLDVSNAIVCITVTANTTVSLYVNLTLAIRDNVLLPLVQTSGQDTKKAMSQKAIADAINEGYGKIVEERERPELIQKNEAVATHTGYYINSAGALVESPTYTTYIFRFDADNAVYTTDAIATGDDPYLSLAVYNGDTIDSAHLVSWARNYNSSTVMPTQNNKLNVLASQSLAVTVTNQATSTFTYYSEPIKYLKPDIIVEAQGGKTSQIKYHSNGVYIACPVNAGYVVYDFNKYTNASTNADGWGIDKAYLYDNDLAPVTNITTSGEWECAVHLVNRPDFSGLRAHGSEVYNGLMFVVDGKYYTESDIDQITEWTPFESVIVYETSKLYDPSDEVTEIADHWKRYIWQGAKLTIKQKLKWLIADTATNCYLAMFPAAKAVTNYFVDNSNFVFKDLANVTPSYNASHCKSISLFSTGGQTAEVCATFGIGEYNAGGTDYDGFSLTDNGGGAYNKCYYLIGTNKAITVDEIWKTESIYEWQI